MPCSAKNYSSFRDNAWQPLNLFPFFKIRSILIFFSVEREPARQKKLVRHGSVEIFEAAYNLTVPNKMARHASQTKLEEIHADHLFIPGTVSLYLQAQIKQKVQTQVSVQNLKKKQNKHFYRRLYPINLLCYQCARFLSTQGDTNLRPLGLEFA
jgi:hypothetical protein